MTIQNSRNHRNRSRNKPEDISASIIAQCIAKAGGDWRAGILLYRIQGRTLHAKKLFERDGKLWLTLTKDQWLKDTGLSRYQYDEALKILKERGLIEADYKKIGRHDRHLQTFIRLPEGFSLSDSLSGKPSGSPDDFPVNDLVNPKDHHPGTRIMTPLSPSGSPDGDPPDHHPVHQTVQDNRRDKEREKEGQEQDYATATAVAKEGTVIKNEEASRKDLVLSESLTEEECSAAAGPAATRLPAIVMQELREVIDYGWRGGVRQVEIADDETYLRCLESVADLEPDEAWRLAHLLAGRFPCEWGAKEFGQAKSLRDAWGRLSGLVMFVCVLHWSGFAKSVIPTGARYAPAMTNDPTLGALLAFKEAAARFAQDQIEACKEAIDWRERVAREKARQEAERKAREAREAAERTEREAQREAAEREAQEARKAAEFISTVEELDDETWEAYKKAYNK